MTLPPNTYGVRCEFNPGGTPYTYLVDEPHHGEIIVGDDVVVASPKGGYKVIHVVDRTEDLAPVDLKYMKYIVQKVDAETYNTLMNNLTGGPGSSVYVDDEKPTHPTSPLIDEGDVNDLVARGMDEPGAPQGQNIQGARFDRAITNK